MTVLNLLHYDEMDGASDALHCSNIPRCRQQNSWLSKINTLPRRDDLDQYDCRRAK